MKKTVRNLIHNFYYGINSSEVKKKFMLWFLNSEFQDQKNKVMEELWVEGNSIPNSKTYAELRRLHHKLSINTKYNKIKILKTVGALLILPILSGLAVYYFTQPKVVLVDPEFVHCTVPEGERKQFFLPDQSEVWLNAGSTLIYTKEFRGSKRILFLSGEANFKVSPNPEKAFVVNTGFLEIQALGTTFNVEAYSGTELSSASLEEGSIKVSVTNSDVHTILKPNEKVIYDTKSNTLVKQQTNAAKISGWKTGNLYFSGATLGEIFKTIERSYGVTINYEDSKYAGRTFTVQLRPNEGINEVLGILKDIAGIHYTIKSNIIYVK